MGLCGLTVTQKLARSQALAQCDGYLRKLGVVKEAVDDTAGAAQMIQRGVRVWEVWRPGSGESVVYESMGGMRAQGGDESMGEIRA